MTEKSPLQTDQDDDVEPKRLHIVQWSLILILVSLISYAVGWGAANKATLEHALANNPMGMTPHVELLPGYIEPAILILGLALFVTVLLEAKMRLKAGDLDLPFRSED